jgi:hypothetical protein
MELGRAEVPFGVQGRVDLPPGCSAEQASDLVHAWSEVGARHVAINMTAQGLSSAREHLAALERVVPAINGQW